jgi:hypothetical protein
MRTIFILIYQYGDIFLFFLKFIWLFFVYNLYWTYIFIHVLIRELYYFCIYKDFFYIIYERFIFIYFWRKLSELLYLFYLIEGIDVEIKNKRYIEIFFRFFCFGIVFYWDIVEVFTHLLFLFVLVAFYKIYTWIFIFN